MENHEKANDATSSPSNDASGSTDEALNEFLNQLSNHLEKLNAKIESFYKNPFVPEFEKETNEIWSDLETIRSSLCDLSQAQIEKSCIHKYNRTYFNTEFNIAQICHQIIIKNAFMLSKRQKIAPKLYIEFKKSCDNFKCHMQTVILPNLSNMDFDPNFKNWVYFQCYGMICEVILGLNSIKQKRGFKLTKDEIAVLFEYFVNLTNITCNDYDTSGPTRNVLPRFFDVVNENIWSENIENFSKTTLENLDKIRQKWLEEKNKERPFNEYTDLDELARKIEGNETSPQEKNFKKIKEKNLRKRNPRKR